MKVEAASYTEPDADGRVYLKLQIDGQLAFLGYDSLKPSLVERGYVFLGAEWESRVPVLRAPVNLNPDLRLKGFTNDPVIAKLAQDFLRNENPLPGDLSIPT